MSSNESLINRAERSIAHGALTNSKRPSCFVKGIYPTHLVRGKGSHVWDERGNKYVDFICGLGSNLLGYANEEINRAMTEQAKKGATLSLGTQLEIDVAENIKALFPWVERVRFLKTGTDACHAAIRIARAATGYSEIYSTGYHGWGDEFTSLTAPATGVPLAMRTHITSGDYPPAGAAALIVEPVMTDSSDQRRAWLQERRTRCDQTQTKLIFDEVITGLRFPRFSVSNYWGIEPDLICLGKALANGMPLSVVAGKADIMECGDYFVSSTFAGETLSLAAAQKTLSLLQTKYKLEDLWDKGAQFLFEFNSIWKEGVWIEGYPTRGAFKGDPYIKALFFQEACKAGILLGPSWFFNFGHIELMDMVLQTFKDILMRIKMGSVELQGEMPKPPFAEKVRAQS